MNSRRLRIVRDVLRFGLAAAFLAAGLLHLTVPGPFVAITPTWVPEPETVVRATGVAELAGVVGLMTRRFRRAAGIGLSLYAVCVFPANLRHAFDPDVALPSLGWAYHGPRLLLQPVIVWLCLWVAEVVDWPFGRETKTFSPSTND